MGPGEDVGPKALVSEALDGVGKGLLCGLKGYEVGLCG